MFVCGKIKVSLATFCVIVWFQYLSEILLFNSAKFFLPEKLWIFVFFSCIFNSNKRIFFTYFMPWLKYIYAVNRSCQLFSIFSAFSRCWGRRSNSTCKSVLVVLFTTPFAWITLTTSHSPSACAQRYRWRVRFGISNTVNM